MRIAITGHRPDKLTHEYAEYVDVLSTSLERIGASFVYEGQAAGIDLLAAESCRLSAIPYEAVVPYAGHRSFNKDPWWQERWDMGVRFADRVEILSDSDKYVGPWLFHNRNKYMVDHADVVLSVWDGSVKGGTKACIDYAIKQQKTIYNIDPSTFDRRILNESPVRHLSGGPEQAEERSQDSATPAWLAGAASTLL